VLKEVNSKFVALIFAGMVPGESGLRLSVTRAIGSFVLVPSPH
jgi:hypothetical protein